MTSVECSPQATIGGQGPSGASDPCRSPAESGQAGCSSNFRLYTPAGPAAADVVLAVWLCSLRQCPAVAIGIAECYEGTPGLNVDFARRHGTTNKCTPGGFDVIDDDLHALLRTWRHLGNSGAKDDGAGRPGRGQLHQAQVLGDLVVTVGVKPTCST